MFKAKTLLRQTPIEKFTFELETGNDISFSNRQIFEGGSFLYVARCAVNTNPFNGLSIKLNDLSAPEIPLRSGLKINVDFEKVFLNGSSYADDSNGVPQIQIYKGYENDALILPELSPGARVKYVAAGNSEKTGGEVVFVVVMSLGSVGFYDESGSLKETGVLPAGTVLPISPLSIRDDSTADVMLIYRD